MCLQALRREPGQPPQLLRFHCLLQGGFTIELTGSGREGIIVIMDCSVKNDIGQVFARVTGSEDRVSAETERSQEGPEE